MLCVGRYSRDPATNEAEVAITVHDDFQGRGIGRFLLKQLMIIAAENGIARFTADVLMDNHRMLEIFRRATGRLQVKTEGNVCHVRFDLPKTGDAARI